MMPPETASAQSGGRAALVFILPDGSRLFMGSPGAGSPDGDGEPE